MSRHAFKKRPVERLRRVLALRHGAAPYDIEPANRRQRRQVERESKRIARKQAGKGGDRG